LCVNGVQNEVLHIVNSCERGIQVVIDKGLILDPLWLPTVSSRDQIWDSKDGNSPRIENFMRPQDLFRTRAVVEVGIYSEGGQREDAARDRIHKKELWLSVGKFMENC